MKLTSWPSAALCAFVMMLSGAPALASGALDGKRFDGVFMERGKTSGDADTLTFRDGRFRSSACDKYGCSDANYKTSSQGDSTVFEAETSVVSSELTSRGRYCTPRRAKSLLSAQSSPIACSVSSAARISVPLRLLDMGELSVPRIVRFLPTGKLLVN